MISLDTLTLPDSLEWTDEYTWQPVSQELAYSLTGAAVVEASERQSGRPFTLRSPEQMAYITRATLNTLKGWAAIAGKTMTLTLRGVSYSVIFRHQDGALEATPLGTWNDSELNNDVLYRVTLRLMEV